MADEPASKHDLDPMLFDTITELGACFDSDEGVLVIPVDFDGHPAYALCDQDDTGRTGVYAVVVDAELITRIKPRDAQAIRITRKEPA